MGRDEGALIGSLVGVGDGDRYLRAVRAPLQECSGTDMPLLTLSYSQREGALKAPRDC